MTKTIEDIILHEYTKNHDHMLQCSLDTMCEGCYSCFLILGYFLPFYPPNNPKNQNFEKMKKTPGDIIILHKCTKNHDHMLHCSWDMVHDRCNYFSFWVIFCPFTTLTAQKIKIKKKGKKMPGDIIILHKCTKNHDHMLYCSWDVVHDRCDFYFLFWTIFCPFTPLKIKILNKWKKALRYHHFTHVCQNYDHMMYSS